MMESAIYLVTQEIAERSGLIQSRYRITDGRFVLDNRDLSRIRLTTDEFIEGLQGVEKVTKEDAKKLIAQNRYQLGVEKKEDVSLPETHVEETETSEEEPTDKNEEE